MTRPFDLQGHRGARGLQPENTLLSFEAALDAGVSSIETDLHLSADGFPVLLHDPRRGDGLPVRGLTLAHIRMGETSVPDGACPLARWFASQHGFSPAAVPTLADLFAFTACYAGAEG